MKPLFVIGGLAVAGTLAVVLARRAQLGAATASGYVPGLRCKTARAVAAIYGRTITDAQCEAADKVDDKIGLGAIVEWLKPGLPPSVAARLELEAKDARNKQLNGEVAVPLTYAVASMASQFQPDGSVPGPLLRGSVLRFKNGGVPFASHPDWSKCIPGTADMTAPGNATDRFWNVLPAESVAAVLAQYAAGTRINSQRLYDNLGRGGSRTLPRTNVAAWKALGVDWSLTPAILHLLTGSGYDPSTRIAFSIVAGVKHECPAGQVLIDVIPVNDHRGGGGEVVASSIIKRCGAPGSGPTTTAPPVAGTGTSTPYTAPPGAAPPGFHWVQASATVPAHWERN